MFSASAGCDDSLIMTFEIAENAQLYVYMRKNAIV